MNKADVLWERMLEADRMVKKLDPAVRSVAFERLLAAYCDDVPRKDQDASGTRLPELPKMDRSMTNAEFFSRFDHDKPAENVKLIGAFLYHRDGPVGFTKADVSRIAAEVGLVIPERPDKTLEIAKDGGKLLFQKTDSGYRPTVHAQVFFKKKYGALERGQTVATRLPQAANGSIGELGTLNTLAAKLQPSSGPDLIVAALYHLAKADGQEPAARKQILDRMKTATAHYKATYSANMTVNLGSLVKANRIRAAAKDNYALAAVTANDLEAKLAQT